MPAADALMSLPQAPAMSMPLWKRCGYGQPASYASNWNCVQPKP
jgi:hypothetical protein